MGCATSTIKKIELEDRRPPSEMAEQLAQVLGLSSQVRRWRAYTVYLAALVNRLYATDVTTLLLLEIKAFAGLQFHVADTPLSVLAATILIMQQGAIRGCC